MPDVSPAMPPRRSRFWLFAPFVLLGLAIAGWTTAWTMIRGETARTLDEWMAKEAALGRQWTCPGRTMGGFPFRIEARCESLSLRRPEFQFALGPVTAIAQVYQPRHLILHAAGPLRTSEGPIRADGNWRSLQASIRATPTGVQRASIVADAPEFRLTGLAPGNIDVSAGRLEMHFRPNPSRPASDGAYDWTVEAAGLALPGLDELIGGVERANLGLDLTVTQARDVAARPIIDELERWRQAGGRIEVARLAVAKGVRRIEGTGQFGLDGDRRPQGRAELAAAGVEGLLGTALGGAGAAAALLGALTGRPAIAPNAPRPGEAASGSPPLRPLPPLRIEGGRVQLGPLPIPGLRVPPLY